MIWRRKRRPAPDSPPSSSRSLEGERVVLRAPTLTDWSQWAKIRNKNRDFLKPFEPTWPEECLGREFYERRLRRQRSDRQQDRGYAFLILTKENEHLIGGVNINNVSRSVAQFASLGYWLDKDRQGMGYMAESLKLVIDYGFKELKLHRFNAGCLKDNERSINLLLKLGFIEEGVAEKYLKINGQWQDHRLFGLPVERWR